MFTLDDIKPGDLVDLDEERVELNTYNGIYLGESLPVDLVDRERGEILVLDSQVMLPLRWVSIRFVTKVYKREARS